MIKNSRSFILFFSLLLGAYNAQAESVKIYTSVFPPVVNENPNRPGYAYELIEAIFQEANLPYRIIQLPWARAQHRVRSEPQSLIFPLTRTPTREENFGWGFELFKTQTHFITLGKVKLSTKTARDQRIGVQLKSSWDNWLTENNYEHVYRFPNEGEDIVQMLMADRLDAWYAERSIARKILPEMNIDNAVFSDPVQIFDTYLATKKDQPFLHMQKLKEAYQNLVKSGKYDEIMTRYNVK